MSFLDTIFKEEQKKKNNVIIVDFSNLLHSSFHAGVRFDRTLKNDEERYAMWRYILLNQILTIKTKLQPDELILAIDSHSWRKDKYKYYKANRVLARAKVTDYNPEDFYKTCDRFVEEITENLPYKVIKSENAEADDVIGVLVKYFAEKNINHIIVSRDKDFVQLLKSQYTRFYDPIDKKYKEKVDPYQFLRDHILCGDSSDGIPNMLSPDNVFVNSDKRQKRITKKVRAEVNELGLEEYAIRNNLIENYERNKMLIDLDEIPEFITNDVIFQYNDQCPRGDFIKIVQFFRKYKIKTLVDKAEKFL
jgi:5'-3' exonuclease